MGNVQVQPVCPDCGGVMPVDPRFVVWCPSCGWNADPGVVEPDRRRVREEAVAERFAAGSGPGGRSVAAVLLAAPVLAVAPAGLAGSVAMVAFYRPLWMSIPLAAIVLTLTTVFRPRLRRLAPDAQSVSREQAPLLYGLLDRIATATDTAEVTQVVVTTDPVISVDRIGWRFRRVLLIGLPAWEFLGPQERIAALAHAVCDDKRWLRDWAVDTAGEVLDNFAASFRTVPLDEIRVETVRRTEGTDLVSPGSSDDQVMHYYLAKVMNVVLGPPIRAYRRLLTRLDLPGRHRSEYAVDRLVAGIAGAEPTACSMERVLLIDIGVRALDRANQERGPALEALRAAAADVPDHELARRVVVSRLRSTRVDAGHPPTHCRTDLLRRRADAQPANPPSVVLDRAESVAVDRELTEPARAAVAERRLL